MKNGFKEAREFGLRDNFSKPRHLRDIIYFVLRQRKHHGTRRNEQCCNFCKTYEIASMSVSLLRLACWTLDRKILKTLAKLVFKSSETLITKSKVTLKHHQHLQLKNGNFLCCNLTTTWKLNVGLFNKRRSYEVDWQEKATSHREIFRQYGV